MSKSQQDVIKEFMHVLDESEHSSGTDALNEAVKTISTYTKTGYSRYNTIQEAIDAFIALCRANSSDLDKFLLDYCGINLKNDDTGAITGSDAGGLKSKNAEDIVQEDTTKTFVRLDKLSSIELNKIGVTAYFNPTASSTSQEPTEIRFKKKGLVIGVPNYHLLTDNQKAIVNGLYNWWISGALDLIEESYGISFETPGEKNYTRLDLSFDNKPRSGTEASTGYSIEEYEGHPVEQIVKIIKYKFMNNSADLVINVAFLNSMVSLDKDANSNTLGGIKENYFDRLLAHELTHAVMQSNLNISLSNSLPQFIMEGTADLTHGGDDIYGKTVAGEDWLIYLAKNPVEIKNALTLTSGTGNYPCYVAGYMFLRWLAKDISEFIEKAEEEELSTTLTLTDESPSEVAVEDKYIIINASTRTEAIDITGNDNDNKIYGSPADDTLRGEGGNDVILGGEGNDSLDGGTGNDTLYGGDGSNTLTGGDGEDIFFYEGGYAVITDYEVGKDIIKDTLDVIQHWGASGNDLILSWDDYGSVTIEGGAGKDVYTIRREDNEADIVYAGEDGAKYIGNSKDNSATITGSQATMWGNDGDDKLTADNATLWGGTGSDVFVYAGGNLLIKDYSEMDKLQIQEGSIYDSVISGNDVILSTKYFNSNIWSWSYGWNYGTINLENAANIIGKDEIGINFVDEDDNSTVHSTENNYELKGGSSADNLVIIGENSTATGGDGDDYITSQGFHNLIDGGEGNDYISSGGNNSTINAGSGDDTVSLSSGNNVILYAQGDGNDYIYGFDDSDTLHITEGNYSTQSDGNDMIITVESGSKDNSGTITLVDSGELEIVNIVSDSSGYESIPTEGTDGDDSINNYNSNISINAGAGNDTISNVGDNVTINAGSGDDYIDSSQSENEKLLVYGGTGNDTIYNANSNSTIVGGTGNDSIINNLGNNSEISGGEGNDYIANLWSNNVTINAGLGDDTVYLNGTEQAIQYGKNDGNDIIYGYNDSTTINIVGSDYETVASENDIIINVDNGTITLKDAATVELNTAKLQTTLEINNAFKSPVALENYVEIANASKRSKAIQITGNALDNSIVGGTKNDTLSGADGNNTLTGGKGKDLFIYSGGKGVITDYDKNDKISTGELAYEDFTINGKDLIFNFADEKSLTVQNGTGKAVNMDSKVNYYTADGVLDKKKKFIKLLATAEKFTANSKVETIDGSATGAIEIIGNNKKNYITAGESGSTLNGGKGNDTLVGGTGADVFVYENKSGKDVIESYGEGDLINLDDNVAIKDAKTKKGDTVLKFKGGSLTVKGTTEFNIGDTLYSGGVFTAGDSAKVYGSFKDAINLDDYAVNNFDGSLAKKKLTITGNASDNYLVGGKGKDSLTGGAGNDKLSGNAGNDNLHGDAGNDTLIGGKGKDSLWGGSGADTFIYTTGEGTDIIGDYNFDDGDLLQILDKQGNEISNPIKKWTFNGDDLTLSINDGGKVVLANFATSETKTIKYNGTMQSF